MLPENCLKWGQTKSCIRELAAYGSMRKAQIGADNVFDFSIGNPSVPAPPEVNETIQELLTNVDSVQLHGYTPASGLPSLRTVIANDLNERYGGDVSSELIYVCCGAAAGLSSAAHALLMKGEEAIAFAPFFPEYRVFVESTGAELVTVAPLSDLQPDLDAFERAINEKTKLVIFNSPNNPSGVILSDESLTRMAEIMDRAQRKYGHSIYLLADEPYRELVYDSVMPSCVTKFYDNSIICYSFSKSLSLPGERIGYLALCRRMKDRELVFDAIAGAARSLGYVNAPSLMQRLVERCISLTSDISKYRENRDLLYSGLTELGFECVKPDGAFYLFVKTPEPDAKAFSERAKKHELLLVPSDDFGLGGYVRIAYCVSNDMIRRSMPAFKALAEEYNL
jgi:aspartate aminotransferase